MKNLVVLLVILTTFAACGGSGGTAGSEASDPPSDASTSPSPSASRDPQFAESETCRLQMTPLVDTALANETNNLGFETFHARYQELDKKLDDALLACSNAVNLPARKVIFEYSLADLAWSYCDREKCANDLIIKHIKAGNRHAHEVQDQLEMTT